MKLDSNEIWKDVEGYEGLYQVSNLGRVRSLPLVFKDCLGRTYRKHGKIVGGSVNHDGYIRYSLSKNNSERKFFGHVLVMNAFCPTEDNNLEINHMNLDKSDNRLANLEWVTHKENMFHAMANHARAGYKGDSHVRNVTTGEVFDNISDAAKSVGRAVSSLCGACSGRQHTCAGYEWEYADEINT